MSPNAMFVLSIFVIAVDLTVMTLVVWNSFRVQRKVQKFTSEQSAVNTIILENLDTFSKIYVGIEAKINKSNKGVTDTLRLEMLTARMVLEIRQSLSAWIASQSPKDALDEGVIAGRAEEALTMAKKETHRPPPVQDEVPEEVAVEIEDAASTPIASV